MFINTYFDFEFTGLHQHTTPISLGMINDYNFSFYGEFTDYNENQVDGWINENIIKKMKFNKNNGYGKYHSLINNRGIECHGSKKFLKKQIEIYFEESLEEDKKIRLVGDVLAWDWVLLCELFGGARKLPDYVFYIPLDISSLMIDPDVNREKFVDYGDLKDKKHDPLHDATIIKECFKKLREKING